MANGTVNRVTLIGYCGKDPEHKQTTGGLQICNVSLATTEMKGSKSQGNAESITEWHNLVFFGKTADLVAQYARKGTRLYVEGKIQTKKWEDKEGNQKSRIQIVVDSMQLLSNKNDNEGNQPARSLPVPESDFLDDCPF